MPALRSDMSWKPFTNFGHAVPDRDITPFGFFGNILRVSSSMSVGECPQPSGQGLHLVSQVIRGGSCWWIGEEDVGNNVGGVPSEGLCCRMLGMECMQGAIGDAE